MKKMAVWLILLIICTFGVAFANTVQPADTEEQQLYDRLVAAADTDQIELFCCLDLDGNGTKELFALTGANEEGLQSLWYVSAASVECLLDTIADSVSHYVSGDTAPYVFTFRFHYPNDDNLYGHCWGIRYGKLFSINAPIYEEYYDRPEEILIFEPAPMNWLSYFYFMDDGELREYGGVLLTEEEFCQFENGQQELDSIKSMSLDGSVEEIILRDNHLIHINFVDDWGYEAYAAFMYDEKNVYHLEHGFGTYKTAANPEIAVYPAAYAKQLRVTGGTVYLRAEPELDAEALDMLSEDETAEYLNATVADDRGTDWYKVRYGDTEGWVSSRYSILESMK